MGEGSQGDALPRYDDLPVKPGAPAGSTWGLWGDDDVLGCLNLLTSERARAGAACAVEGAVFNLNLELELPSPPLFGRGAFEHVVHTFPSGGHDDELRGWNTQSSTQWDGFRHVRHPVHGFYNGIADEAHGMHFWARKGLVGRAVLADVARWRESVGRPINPAIADPIEPDDLLATLDAQGVSIEPGDVLLVRTGWLGWYRALGQDARDALGHLPSLANCGLRPGLDTVRTLWDLHIAAIAADNPSVEVWPPATFVTEEELARIKQDPAVGARVFMHPYLLALLGLPLGELFDLDALADHCAGDGRYTCLFTSAPLNIESGVASPPNALAVK
jgi:hypothetical protein